MQGVLTSSHTAPEGRTSTVEPGVCPQLPVQAVPPQNHLSDEQLVATLVSLGARSAFGKTGAQAHV